MSKRSKFNQPTALIDYINHRGDRSSRRILPLNIFWGSNEWHKEPQWLLNAYDFGKEAGRVFAMKNILGWENQP